VINSKAGFRLARNERVRFAGTLFLLPDRVGSSSMGGGVLLCFFDIFFEFGVCGSMPDECVMG
jgi:hypothetical protein